MSTIHTLSIELRKHFSWHPARVECAAQAIIALFKAESVNLSKISLRFLNPAKSDSCFKRMQRFLRHQIIDYQQVGCLLFKMLLSCLSEQFLVTLDRTNWKYGKQNINILAICIVHNGLAVPIVWELLDKRGNSDCAERTDLLEEFLSIVPKSSIRAILGDREFIGEKWIDYLNTHKVPYVMRIKKNTVATFHGGTSNFSTLFYNLKQCRKSKPYKVTIWGCETRIKGYRMIKNKALLVVAYSDGLKECPITLYKQRWTIEVLFKCLKTRGFNIEDSHINNLDRFKKLLAFVSIAFTWAFKIGEFKHRCIAIRKKKHGYPEYSVFFYGKKVIIEILERPDKEKTAQYLIVAAFRKDLNLKEFQKSVL